MKYRFDKKNNPSLRTPLFIAIILAIIFFWPHIRPPLYGFVEPITKRMFEIVGIPYLIPPFISTFTSSRIELLEQQKKLQATIESLENELREKDAIVSSLYPLYYQSSSTPLRVPIVTSSLARDITGIYGSIMFNKGYGEGVEVGSIVYLRGKHIVCEIQEVYARTSLCLLYSGYGNTVEGVTASSSVTLTLEGRGGHYIANVVRDTPVSVGEKIFFRKDQSFILGEITQIINNDQDTSWHVLVRSSYNPAASSLYYIEKKL